MTEGMNEAYPKWHKARLSAAWCRLYGALRDGEVVSRNFQLLVHAGDLT